MEQISLFDFNENSIENIEKEEIIITSSTNFQIGEEVIVDYGDNSYRGIIVNIYNNGDTFNCIFGENRHTAFFKDNVKKIWKLSIF